MTEATDVAPELLPPSAESVTAPPPVSLLSSSGVPDSVDPEVLARLALVLSSAGRGGLTGIDSEQALAVVEAVEAVKAWADSISVDATAAMVNEFETEFEHLKLEPSRSTPPSA